MAPETSAKRPELLREAVPQLSRVAVIWNPDVRAALLDFKLLEEPARSMGVQLQSIEVSRADDLARGLSAITDARAEALMVLSPNPVMFANHGQLVSFAQRHRLPSMYGVHEYVDGRWAHGVRSERPRCLSTRGVLRRQDPERYPAARSASRATDDLRARHQREDREGNRDDDSTVATESRGPSDRLESGARGAT
jgi:hypothetical protein